MRNGEKQIKKDEMKHVQGGNQTKDGCCGQPTVKPETGKCCPPTNCCPGKPKCC